MGLKCEGMSEKKNNLNEESVMTSVYLIGKIKKNCWRHSIFEKLRDYNADFNNNLLIDITGKFMYGGPFFIGCDHGCFHGNNSHGASANSNEVICAESINGIYDISEFDNANTKKNKVYNYCLHHILKSDLCFAYIEDNTCYGSLFEIGFATAMGKPIYIYHKSTETIADMWFPNQAKYNINVNFNDPINAWLDFESYIN
jgi:hypothetical protein